MEEHKVHVPADREQKAKARDILQSKEMRRNLDAVLQKLRAVGGRTSRERSLSITKIEEAIMWLGMDLKALNDGVSCYKHGYDETTKVQPTADGVLAL